MDKNILTINTGSSSKKYAVFTGENPVFTAHFEKTETGFAVTYDNESSVPVSEEIYNGSLQQVVSRSKDKHNTQINAAGIRVVAVGKQFAQNEVIDDQYLALLTKEAERDPAHTPLVIAELAELNKILPGIPVVAASDSAFHLTMPAIARRYAIPSEAADATGIERAGFHGLSFSSAVSQLEKILGKIPERAVVCHMGNGVSISALSNGKSVETSMGYSPLSGVPMSTRVGEIDPEAVLRLTERSDAKNVRNMLYSQSGLLALSGRSGDMRVLLEAEKNGDEKSKLAIDAFAYRVKLFIGAYAAALSGLDVIVFSGTMGVRSAAVRSRVLSGLERFGVIVDAALNENAQPMNDIADIKSQVRIFVLKTDEEQEIAKAVKELIV